MVIKVDGKAKLDKLEAEKVQEVQIELTSKLNSEFAKKHPITTASLYTSITSLIVALVMLAMYDVYNGVDFFELIHFLMWSIFFFSTAVTLVAGNSNKRRTCKNKTKMGEKIIRFK